MKRIISLSLAMLMLVALLAGCSSSSTPPASDNPGNQTETPTGTTPDNTDTPDEDLPALRTDMNMSMGAEPDGLDPHIHGASSAVLVKCNIFETLTALTVDGIDPRLAETWSHNDAGDEWTYKLREDIICSDGTQMKASDVAFSIERAKMAPGLALFTYMITEVVVVDEYTVTMKLLFPHAAFATLMSAIYIIPEAPYRALLGDNALTETPANTAHVGSGPYMIDAEGFNISQKMSIVRNPNWRGEEPQLERINYFVMGDALTIYSAFKAGELDASGIPVAFWNEFDQENYNTYFEPTITTDYIILNNQAGVFTDKRVRQAFSYAMNRQEMIDLVYDGIGFVADAAAPPSLVFNASAPTSPYTYDPDKARELFADAGVTDLGTIKVAGNSKMAEIVEQYLSQVGVTIRVELCDGAALNNDLANMNFDSAIGGIGLIGDFFCYEYLYATTGLFNSAKYSNPEIDALFAEAISTMDEAARTAIYKQIIDITNEDAPYVYISNGTDRHATQKGLKNGWGNYDFTGYYWYHQD